LSRGPLWRLLYFYSRPPSCHFLNLDPDRFIGTTALLLHPLRLLLQLLPCVVLDLHRTLAAPLHTAVQGRIILCLNGRVGPA